MCTLKTGVTCVLRLLDFSCFLHFVTDEAEGDFSREMTFTVEGISSFSALLYHSLHITSFDFCPRQTYL